MSGSWWTAVKKSMHKNMLCCSSKVGVEEDINADVLQSEVEESFARSYVEVDPRDQAEFPPAGGTTPVQDRESVLQTLSLLGRIRVFLQKLKPARFYSPSKRHSGSSLRRILSKHSNKVCPLVENTQEEALNTSFPTDPAIDVHSLGEMTKMDTPDALGEECHLFEEESRRLRHILLQDNNSYENYLDLSDSEKARNAEEIYQSMDKCQQHAVRHHSHILVNDIMSSLFD